MKKKKIIVISSLVVVGLVTTYFLSGIVGVKIANDNFVNKRYDFDTSLEENLKRRTMLSVNDYPLMQNKETVSFSLDKDTLSGYLYKVDNPKGLIISSHGIDDFAFGSTIIYQNYFLNNGYDVFSFDMRGCGNSTGKGQVDMYDSVRCLNNAINYCHNNESLKNLPFYLVGHSRGAYGSVVASNELNYVKAVISYSAYDSPNEFMYDIAVKYTSKALILTKPAFTLGDTFINGKTDFIKASDIIKNNKNTKYVILHGENDEIVNINSNASLFKKVNDMKLDNVISIKLEERRHTNPWRSVEGLAYSDEINKAWLKEVIEIYKKDPIKGEEIFKEKLPLVDKEKKSEPDLKVLDKIKEILTNIN